MATFTATDVLSDIEKLETMLTNSRSSQSSSSHSSCSDSSSFHPTTGHSFNSSRFNGSTRIYLRNLNKLLVDIEEKQKILSTNSGSILKRLQPPTNSRSLTFTSLFARPSIPLNDSKSISFSQLLSRNAPYSNPQTEYGCARLNEKLWVVHCREQLIKAVNDEYPEGTNGIDIDWEKISNYHLDNKWSANVCRNAWQQLCHPKINQSKWTTKEEQRLIAIVEREPLSADRWNSIAEELGTDRSAYLCAKRYMQITNEKFSKRPLETNERQQMIATIQDDNQGYYTKYNQLAYKLGDRTREFIYNQWLHIDPSCKRGRWSEDEQAQLLRRIDQQTHKITNWPLVSAPVQTRSARQCRERALDTLKNGQRTTKEKHRLFTSDEDRLLLDQYNIHGPKWSLIAKEFSSRTDNSLLVRYRMLIKAKTQWTWFRQINERMKDFLQYIYGKRTDQQSDDDANNLEIQHDLQQFGFYRRGFPIPITDDEFEWFKSKPELIERIGQIVLNEFQNKKLCARKFKTEIKSWFVATTPMNITDEQIRQMLCRTIPSVRKRKSISHPVLSPSKRTRIDPTNDLECKEEPRCRVLPSILSSTSRHILRPVANQFFTTQSTSKVSVATNGTHFCPYMILMR